jgi:hypothetical protein
LKPNKKGNKKMPNVIVEYIRDNDNEPHGCLVGKMVGDTVMIGLSSCNGVKDRFEKARGRKIAEGRIDAGRCSAMRKETLQMVYQKDLLAFRDRCHRYFKTDKIEVVGS